MVEIMNGTAFAIAIIAFKYIISYWEVVMTRKNEKFSSNNKKI